MAIDFITDLRLNRKNRRHDRSYSYMEVEDATICLLASALGCDRNFLDELIIDPENRSWECEFSDARLVVRHPWRGDLVARDYDDFEDVAEWLAQRAEERRCRKRDGFRYFLYHIYGENDRLLYIGITRNPKAREKAHRKRWGSTIERVEYEEFPSHEEVLAEEARRIALHNPPFNYEGIGEDPDER